MNGGGITTGPKCPVNLKPIRLRPNTMKGLWTDAEADLIASEGVIAGEHDNRKMIWGDSGGFCLWICDYVFGFGIRNHGHNSLLASYLWRQKSN